MTELYANNPAASDIRASLDVDCVIELGTRSTFDMFEQDLRSKGFSNDTSVGSPICRWIYKKIKVDIMPSDPTVIGFTNQWYSDGIENKIEKLLPDGNRIFVFMPVYYLAAKFEAHKNRGGVDLRQSHDFEDIIYVMDNYSDLLTDISRANEKVKKYLIQENRRLLKNPNLSEGVECALPYGAGAETTDLILSDIKKIAFM